MISTREWFNAAAQGWENKAFALIALQAPVAADLRTLVGGLHIAADLQRMGGLAIQICSSPAVGTPLTCSRWRFARASRPWDDSPPPTPPRPPKSCGTGTSNGPGGSSTPTTRWTT
nr:MULTISPECIES: PhoU domain-containing protein [unclassified Rhodococcus (in: high G+C Gram-positive bacteria)]